MLKRALPFYSYILHPLFVPIYGTLLYFLLQDPYFNFQQKYLILFQIIIITLFIPISFYYLLQSLGKVDSVMISKLAQRKIPLLIQALLLIVLLTRSVTIDRFPELFFFFLGGFVSTLITLLFLFCKIKASIHMIGISSLTAFTIGLSIHNHLNVIPMIAFLILLNGIVGSSRLEMNAHTTKELVIGFFSGILPQVLLWFLWL